MSEFPFIDADRLRRLLPMQGAVDALEVAFGSGGLPAAPRGAWSFSRAPSSRAGTTLPTARMASRIKA